MLALIPMSSGEASHPTWLLVFLKNSETRSLDCDIPETVKT